MIRTYDAPDRVRRPQGIQPSRLAWNPPTSRHERTLELRDCTMLRQAIEARPPVAAHAAAWLLILSITAAVGWAALTPASVVVRSTGRVRPMEPPLRIFAPRGSKLDGRVAAVRVRLGDKVRRGDVLVEFDRGVLENALAGLERKIEASQGELAQLDAIATRLVSQYQAARAKALAELAVGRTEVEQAQRRRRAESRRAQIDLAAKQDVLRRTTKLARTNAVSPAQLVEDQAKVRDAEQKLALAELPVELGKLEVLTHGVELVERKFTLDCAELESRRVAKRGEIDTAGKERANLILELERAVVRSPIEGMVVEGNPRVGDLVAAGDTVFAIARQQGFRFEVELLSADVGLLRPGMPAIVKFDAFDYQRYGTMIGTVTYLSPDSTPADPLQPKRGAAFVAKIDLSGDYVCRGEYRGAVKLGMSGRAEIVMERSNLLTILLRRLRSSISLN